MQQLCLVTREGVSLLGVSDAAEYLGFRTVCGRITLEKMVEQRPFPCILHWNQAHFVVFGGVLLYYNMLIFLIFLVGYCLYYSKYCSDLLKNSPTASIYQSDEVSLHCISGMQNRTISYDKRRITNSHSERRRIYHGI